jgi:LuxR family transcriptional regulator, maltose regulon positive regulatory protein
MIRMGAVREPPLRTVRHGPKRYVTPENAPFIDGLKRIGYTGNYVSPVNLFNCSMSADASATPESFVHFGTLLRFLRVRARLSQRELSIAVGYSEAHLSRLEAGQRRPDPDAVRAHFLPALDLQHASPWSERLLALAATRDLPVTVNTPPSSIVAPSQPIVAPAPGGELLTTKLYRPQLRASQVARPRLTARLDALMGVPLAVLIAPAGFGKTTLLAEWMSTRPAAAFLSLDDGDNDRARFVRHLVAALQQRLPMIGAATLALTELAAVPPAALLQPLLNELAALHEPIVLVLDDYHHIQALEVHAVLTLLCERTPPQLHLLIASREDPPLPLARLRARGQLVELRAAQLRFQADEVVRFLRETMALGIGDEELATLERRTEGWAAGLQLAALALAEQEDQRGFVAAFAGTNRFVVDYLSEEILDWLPTHLRHFLLHTAVLERMCGELCDAVLGLVPLPDDSYSRLVLADLEQRNLFLVPLDSERRWYRYHHLFADTLRAQLKQGADPRQIAELHQRASAWYEAEGLPREALQHAFAAADYERAARLIAHWGERFIDTGELATLRGWLAALPPTLRQNHARLALLHAHLHLTAHDLAATYTALDQAEQVLPGALSAGEVAQAQGEIATTRAMLATLEQDYPRALIGSEQALALLAPDQKRLRGRALLQRGIALGYSRQFEAEHRAYAEALQLCEAANDLPTLLYLQIAWGVSEFVDCRLHEAEQRYRQGLQLAERHGLTALPMVGLLHGNYSELLAERDEWEAAEAHAQQAIAIVRDANAPRPLLKGYLFLGYIQHLRGDAAGADELLAQVEELSRVYRTESYHYPDLAFYRMLIQLGRGYVVGAEQALTKLGVSPASAVASSDPTQALCLIRLWLAQGRLEQVAPLLAHLYQIASVPGQGWALLNTRILHGLVLAGEGQEREALALLEQALAVGAPTGVVRSFVEPGPPAQALLQAARDRGIFPNYCERLLAAFQPA